MKQYQIFMAKVLEDIVQEDLRRKKALRSTVNSKVGELFDSLPARHPIISSGLVFFGCEYLRKTHPEIVPSSQLSLFTAYTTYSFLGIM